MELDNNFNVKRTDSFDEDFKNLIILLDKELGAAYTEEMDFYNQYNQVDDIKNVIVVYLNELPVGCGAIKKYDSDTVEVKRMFTRSESRGNGVASVVLNELENWAIQLLYKNSILETGTKQHAAIALYKKKGYTLIPNYGQYEGVSTSICFEKRLT